MLINHENFVFEVDFFWVNHPQTILRDYFTEA
jgi:hypothetical protein